MTEEKPFATANIDLAVAVKAKSQYPCDQLGAHLT